MNINPLDTTGSNPDDEVYITIYYTGLTNMYFWFDNSNFPTVSTHVFDYGSSSGEKFLIGNKNHIPFLREQGIILNSTKEIHLMFIFVEIFIILLKKYMVRIPLDSLEIIQ